MKNRNKKVSTYEGISEFKLTGYDFFQYVDIFAYDIINPDGWRSKRRSIPILNISRDGLYSKVSYYRKHQLHIDIDNNSKIVVDGVDII